MLEGAQASKGTALDPGLQPGVWPDWQHSSTQAFRKPGYLRSYLTCPLPWLQSELGQQSPFGCELVPLLKTVADNGEFDAVKYSEVRVAHTSAHTSEEGVGVQRPSRREQGRT